MELRIALLLFALLVTPAFAQRGERPPVTISVEGEWMPVIDSAAIFLGSIDSAQTGSPLSLEVHVTANRGWRIDARRTADAGLWHDALTLMVEVEGYAAPRAIGSANSVILLQGASNVNDAFDLVYILSGLGPWIPPGTYSTMITYTVTAD